MSFFEDTLRGRTIDSVYCDSEVTYLMMSDGTQVAIRGIIIVEPRRSTAPAQRPDSAAGA